MRGSEPAIKNESSNGLQERRRHGRDGADVGSPDSATSQFFINVRNNDFLNKESAQDGVGYAVFGKVVEGMDVVGRSSRSRPASHGTHQNVPVEAVTIKRRRSSTTDGSGRADPASDAGAEAVPHRLCEPSARLAPPAESGRTSGVDVAGRVARRSDTSRRRSRGPGWPSAGPCPRPPDMSELLAGGHDAQSANDNLHTM